MKYIIIIIILLCNIISSEPNHLHNNQTFKLGASATMKVLKKRLGTTMLAKSGESIMKNFGKLLGTSSSYADDIAEFTIKNADEVAKGGVKLSKKQLLQAARRIDYQKSLKWAMTDKWKNHALKKFFTTNPKRTMSAGVHGVVGTLKGGIQGVKNMASGVWNARKNFRNYRKGIYAEIAAEVAKEAAVKTRKGAGKTVQAAVQHQDIKKAIALLQNKRAFEGLGTTSGKFNDFNDKMTREHIKSTAKINGDQAAASLKKSLDDPDFLNTVEGQAFLKANNIEQDDFLNYDLFKDLNPDSTDLPSGKLNPDKIDELVEATRKSTYDDAFQELGSDNDYYFAIHEEMLEKQIADKSKTIGLKAATDLDDLLNNPKFYNSPEFEKIKVANKLTDDDFVDDMIFLDFKLENPGSTDHRMLKSKKIAELVDARKKKAAEEAAQTFTDTMGLKKSTERFQETIYQATSNPGSTTSSKIQRGKFMDAEITSVEVGEFQIYRKDPNNAPFQSLSEFVTDKRNYKLANKQLYANIAKKEKEMAQEAVAIANDAEAAKLVKTAQFDTDQKALSDRLDEIINTKQAKDFSNDAADQAATDLRKSLDDSNFLNTVEGQDFLKANNIEQDDFLNYDLFKDINPDSTDLPSGKLKPDKIEELVAATRKSTYDDVFTDFNQKTDNLKGTVSMEDYIKKPRTQAELTQIEKLGIDVDLEEEWLTAKRTEEWLTTKSSDDFATSSVNNEAAAAKAAEIRGKQLEITEPEIPARPRTDQEIHDAIAAKNKAIANDAEAKAAKVTQNDADQQALSDRLDKLLNAKKTRTEQEIYDAIAAKNKVIANDAKAAKLEKLTQYDADQQALTDRLTQINKQKVQTAKQFDAAPNDMPQSRQTESASDITMNQVEDISNDAADQAATNLRKSLNDPNFFHTVEGQDFLKANGIEYNEFNYDDLLNQKKIDELVEATHKSTYDEVYTDFNQQLTEIKKTKLMNKNLIDEEQVLGDSLDNAKTSSRLKHRSELGARRLRHRELQKVLEMEEEQSNAMSSVCIGCLLGKTAVGNAWTNFYINYKGCQRSTITVEAPVEAPGDAPVGAQIDIVRDNTDCRGRTFESTYESSSILTAEQKRNLQNIQTKLDKKNQEEVDQEQEDKTNENNLNEVLSTQAFVDPDLVPLLPAERTNIDPIRDSGLAMALDMVVGMATDARIPFPRDEIIGFRGEDRTKYSISMPVPGEKIVPERVEHFVTFQWENIKYVESLYYNQGGLEDLINNNEKKYGSSVTNVGTAKPYYILNSIVSELLDTILTVWVPLELAGRTFFMSFNNTNALICTAESDNKEAKTFFLSVTTVPKDCGDYEPALMGFWSFLCAMGWDNLGIEVQIKDNFATICEEIVKDEMIINNHPNNYYRNFRQAKGILF